MGNPIEDEARAAVNGDDNPDDTKAFDGFAAEPHGQPEKSGALKWSQRLGVAAKESDFAPIPTTRELLDEADQMPLPPMPPRSRHDLPPLPDDLPGNPEEGLRGSVWRLDQRTAINFARAQGAFITAQNAFLKDKDTAKIAAAQHLFIEAQAAVLEKFGVV